MAGGPETLALVGGARPTRWWAPGTWQPDAVVGTTAADERVREMASRRSEGCLAMVASGAHARTSALASRSRWCPTPAMVRVISSSARSVRSMCRTPSSPPRSEEHTSELQSRQYLVCRLLLEKKKKLLRTQSNASSPHVCPA